MWHINAHFWSHESRSSYILLLWFKIRKEKKSYFLDSNSFISGILGFRHKNYSVSQDSFPIRIFSFWLNMGNFNQDDNHWKQWRKSERTAILLERFLCLLTEHCVSWMQHVKGHGARCHVCRVNINKRLNCLIACSTGIYSSDTMPLFSLSASNINIWFYAIGISGRVLAKERSRPSCLCGLRCILFAELILGEQ